MDGIIDGFCPILMLKPQAHPSVLSIRLKSTLAVSHIIILNKDFFVCDEWKPKLLILHMMDLGILGFQLLRHIF